MGNGGIERHSAFLAHRLQESGDSVIFTCAPGSTVESSCRTLGVRTLNLDVRNSGDLRAVVKLSQALIHYRTQVLHVHSRRDYFIAALSILAIRPFTKISLFLHIHLIRSLGVPERISGRFFGSVATRIFAVSEAVKQELIQVNQLSTQQISVVYNGLSPAEFLTPGTDQWTNARCRIRAELNLSAESFVVGMVGRLDAKGQTAAVTALPTIIQHLPNVTILAIGPEGERGQSDKLIALAEANGCLNHLAIAGPREDISDCLAGMDAFMHLPTDDALPTVLIEAMFASLPVIASDVGGVPEIVLENVTGVLVDPGVPTQIAAALLRVKQHAEMGLAGRARAEQLFSSETQLNTLRRHYTEAWSVKSH